MLLHLITLDNCLEQVEGQVARVHEEALLALLFPVGFEQQVSAVSHQQFLLWMVERGGLDVVDRIDHFQVQVQSLQDAVVDLDSMLLVGLPPVFESHKAHIVLWLVSVGKRRLCEVLADEQSSHEVLHEQRPSIDVFLALISSRYTGNSQ